MKVLSLMSILFALQALAQNDVSLQGGDLEDERLVAQKLVTSELNKIERQEKYLLGQIGAGGGLIEQSPLIHLRIRGCLMNGDYHRKMDGLYSRAEKVASQMADEKVELGARVTERRTPADTVRHELKVSEERLRELSSNGSLDPVEKMELDSLPAVIKQIKASLAVVVSASPSTQLREAAVASLRSQAKYFHFMGRQAHSMIVAFDSICLSYHDLLVFAAEQDRDRKMLNRLPLTPYLPARGGGANVIPAAADPSSLNEEDRKRYLDLMNKFRDTEELKKQIKVLEDARSGSL